MRLLKCGLESEVTLTTDLVDDVPPYFILSHTWSINNDDEVTFDDLQNNRGESKPGWEKIRFCEEQAKKDGHPQYFWVDTCCINKANYTELSEAITSMFRWYRNAVKCYVYLPDVSAQSGHDDFAQYQWEAAFRDSRWFKRGWTLQELLAPAVVEFYSRNGEYLGDKRTLEELIHNITQIPISALRGGSLSLFPIYERLQWTTGRITKKPEDQAYCLLGIFDIFMPLIYGEGQNAMNRLKEEIDKRARTHWSTPEPSNLVDFGRIERKLDNIVRQLQKGGRDDFSVAYSDSEAESENDPVSQQQWGSLRKELIGDGFSKDLIDDLKPWITMKMRLKVQNQQIRSPNGIATEGAASNAPSRPDFESNPAEADVFRDSAQSQYPPPRQNTQFQGYAAAPVHSSHRASSFADPWPDCPAYSPSFSSVFLFSRPDTPYTSQLGIDSKSASLTSAFQDPSARSHTAPVIARLVETPIDPSLSYSTARPALISAYSEPGIAESTHAPTYSPRYAPENEHYLRQCQKQQWEHHETQQRSQNFSPGGLDASRPSPGLQEFPSQSPDDAKAGDAITERIRLQHARNRAARRYFREKRAKNVKGLEHEGEALHENNEDWLQSSNVESSKLRRSPSISSMTSVHSEVSEHDSQGNITKRTVTNTTTTYYSADDSASDNNNGYSSSDPRLLPHSSQYTDGHPGDSPPLVTNLSSTASHPNRGRRHKCRVCQECFTTQSALLIHKFSEHIEKLFRCPVMTCDKKFTNMDSLRQHGRMHRQNDHVIGPFP